MDTIEQNLIKNNSEKALTSLQINKERLNNLKSLDEVYLNIQIAEEEINQYLEELQQFTAPQVDAPWYRIGGPSKEEINRALDGIVQRTRSHLDLICKTDLGQSKNIQNLCLLVGLLAIAEGKLFSQFREFAGDAEAATDILVDYERDLNEIAHNGEDTADNVAKMAQIMSGILEEKNKQIISFKAYIEKIRKDNMKDIGLLKNEMKNVSDTIQRRMNGFKDSIEGVRKANTDDIRNLKSEMKTISGVTQKSINGFKDSIEGVRTAGQNDIGQLKSEMKQISESCQMEIKDFKDELHQENLQLKSDIDKDLENQRKQMLRRTEKSFLDSSFFKILVAIIAVVALLVAILL